ncbi:hypothetical protein ACUN0C_08170 [Faunimonas sp. B44]|uniref:hypothetical protein n=1 Tax=Faunimonas sp. B44 TaxID=3461493 RepID=UPI004044D5F9
MSGQAGSHRFRRAFGRTLAAGLALTVLTGFNRADALHFLDGRWSGDGITLTINRWTMQGNDDPAKPFQWDPIRIRDATAPWIVFMIGKEVYIVTIGEDRDEISVFVRGRPATLRRVR